MIITAHLFKLSKRDIAACKAQGYDVTHTLTIHNGSAPTDATKIAGYVVKGKREARLMAKAHGAKPWNF